MSIARIIQQAQQTIEAHQAIPLDPVEIAKVYFGETAWREIDQFRITGKLPGTIRGLELLELEIRLDEEI